MRNPPLKVAFYGNCQMQALASVYVRFIYPFTGGDVRYIDAYQPISVSDWEFLAELDLLVAQKAPMPSPTPWDTLPCHISDTAVRTHLVPHVSAEFLWPYSGRERVDNPSGPGIENGVWPGEIGDAFLDRQLQADATPEAALSAYLAIDPSSMHLDRRYEIAINGLRSREADTPYRAADIIEANFQTEPLFRSTNHPGVRLSRHMALTLLQELDVPEAGLSRATQYLTTPIFPITEMPVHPAVARHFGLAWATADRQYQFHREGSVTFEGFVLQYMSGQHNAPLFAGIQALQKKDAPAALGHLQQAIRLSPGSARCHAALAEAQWLSGKFPAARRSAEQAARLDPGSHDHPQQIAKIRASLGNFAAARRAMQAAIALGAEPGPGYRDIAAIAAEQGLTAEAQHLLEAASLADPLDPTTRLEARRLQAASDDVSGAEHAIQVCLAHLRAGQLAPALEAARRAASLAPHGALCWGLLGDLLMRTGSYKEGEEAFRSAIDLEPNDSGLREQLASWQRISRPPDHATRATNDRM
jgi:tetratricopeptide (TPR) repeat protein